ncbi:hypothetical protein HDU90_002018, partial [Geranomyces variabilis]
KLDVTNKEIIDLVKLKLDGAAATCLQKTFAPEEDALGMRKQLQSLKQTGSVTKYNDQFRQIAKQFIDPNWEELKFHYLQGLDPKLSDLVQAYPLNTKSQSKLFLAALRFESAHGFHGLQEKGKSTPQLVASAVESDYVKTNEKKNLKGGKKPYKPSSSLRRKPNNSAANQGGNKKSTREKEHKCKL